MMTRIKYKYVNKQALSNEFINYEGKRFSIILTYTKECYIVNILQGNDVVYRVETKGLARAKRIARTLLIDKYNVRLNEEIRPR